MTNLSNQVQLIGFLGTDPELFTFDKGNSLCKFSLATNESYKDQNGEQVQKTDWHNVIIWGNRGKYASEHLKKGERVAVSGKLTNRSYETDSGDKRYITEIVVSDILFLSPKDN